MIAFKILISKQDIAGNYYLIHIQEKGVKVIAMKIVKMITMHLLTTKKTCKSFHRLRLLQFKIKGLEILAMSSQEVEIHLLINN